MGMVVFFFIWYVILVISVYFMPHFLLFCGLSVFYLGLWHLFFAPVSLWVWGVFFGVFVLWGIPQIRRLIVVRPFLHWFRGHVPQLSETEKEALVLGDVWQEAKIFQGKIDFRHWEKSHDLALTKEEQHFLAHETEQLCALLDEWQIVHHLHDLPKPVWQFMKEKGFFALIIKKAYGGKQFSDRAHSDVIMKLASCSMTAAITVMVPNSLGPAELLERYGTQRQKKHYLPRLAQGKEIPCFALTEEEIGSDATSLKSTAVVCYGKVSGKRVLGISLTFSKRYITLAPVATLIGLAFYLYDPEKLLSNQTDLGITLALVGRKAKGVTIGSRHIPLGIPFMNGPISGKAVWVPLTDIIGGPDYIGKGWTMLITCLAVGRGISLPAVSTASAALATVTTAAYSVCREQFSLPIGQFQGVQEKLAEMAGYTYLIAACRAYTLRPLHLGLKTSVIASIAKYHMTELSRMVINHGMDIHAGKAIILGPKNYLAFAYQGLPISITVEGSNIMTRNLMIFGQGAMRCHPYAADELNAVWIKDQQKAIATLDHLLTHHLATFFQNKTQAFWHQWTGGKTLRVLPLADQTIGRNLRMIVRFSKLYAYLVDVVMLQVGGRLKREENMSARLGDILSNLYLATAAFDYWYQRGQKKEEVPLLQWAMGYCLCQVQTSFFDFFANYPKRFMATCLCRLFFPLGRIVSAPSDRLSQQVARFLLAPSAWRDELSSYLYVPTDESSAVAQLLIAEQKKRALDGPLKKIKQAIKVDKLSKHQPFGQLIQAAYGQKIINQKEYKALSVYAKLYAKIIAVDDFKRL